MYEDIFSSNGLSMERLRALVETAEAGSIAKAVQHDSIRQSLYSRQLKELEAHFGIELTHRKGKGLSITPAGKQLARLAREHFQGLTDFKRQCRNITLNYQFAAGDSLLHWLLIPHLGSIQKEIPQTTFSLHNFTSKQIIENIRELSVDFGIVRTQTLIKPLQHKLLGKIEYALYVPKQLFPSRISREQRKAWALKNAPITTQANQSLFSESLRKESAKASQTLTISLFCESFPESRQALLTGQYASILPTIAEIDLDPRRIVKFEIPFLKKLNRNISFIWNPRLIHMRPNTEKLITTLRKHLSRQLQSSNFPTET